MDSSLAASMKPQVLTMTTLGAVGRRLAVACGAQPPGETVGVGLVFGAAERSG